MPGRQGHLSNALTDAKRNHFRFPLCGVIPLFFRELIEKRAVYAMRVFFVDWAVPQFALDFAGRFIAEPLKQILHEFNIRFAGKNGREFVIRRGKYAVSAVVFSVNNLNVFHCGSFWESSKVGKS